MIAQKNTLPPLSILLYVFAVSTLILALLILVSALGFRSTADASLMILRSGFNPIVNSMIDMLIQGVQSVGTVLSALIFTVSLLMYAAGRQQAHIRDLSCRMAEMEARMAAMEKLAA